MMIREREVVKTMIKEREEEEKMMIKQREKRWKR